MGIWNYCITIYIWLQFIIPLNCKRSTKYRTNYWTRSTLTHWGWVTHIYVSEIIIIRPDNGLSPGRRQAIIWTNARILSIGPLGINVSESLIEIIRFSFKKMLLKMSAKWRLFRRGTEFTVSFAQTDRYFILQKHNSSRYQIDKAVKPYIKVNFYNFGWQTDRQDFT